MILKELFNKISVDEAIDLTKELYGVDKLYNREPMDYVFNSVKNKIPRENDYVASLEISILKIAEGDKTYFDVCGYSDYDKEYYALDLTDWDVWLGLPISKQTQDSFTEAEILVHCIQEMTLFGTEESMLQQRKELEQLIEDIDSGKEKLIEFNSLEDLLDEIKK